MVARARFRRWILAVAVVASVSGCSESEPGPGPTPPTTQPAPVGRRVELPVVPIAQQTQVWCWAASAEMILRFYGEPNLNPAGNYQCGVVGGYYYIAFGPTHPCSGNCFLCQTPASSLFEIQRIINGYGQVANFFGISARVLTSQARFGALSLAELIAELDANRPILAGFSFPGQPTLPGISGHAVVISGYDTTTTIPTVTVRDPYPYERFIPPSQNPYLIAGGSYQGPGTYRIALAALSGGVITWGNTLRGIQ